MARRLGNIRWRSWGLQISEKRKGDETLKWTTKEVFEREKCPRKRHPKVNSETAVQYYLHFFSLISKTKRDLSS